MDLELVLAFLLFMVEVGCMDFWFDELENRLAYQLRFAVSQQGAQASIAANDLLPIQDGYPISCRSCQYFVLDPGLMTLMSFTSLRQGFAYLPYDTAQAV